MNASHIVRKKAGSHSSYPGVVKSGEKWQAQIYFDGHKYALGTYSETEAANAYAHVQEHRAEIEEKIAPIPSDASKANKKSIRAANLVIVKSYIQTTLHPNVKLIRDQLEE
jgi:hypothetical protein